MPALPLSDFGLEWFNDIVGQISSWFREQLTESYRTLTNSLFGTPTPDGTGTDVVFSVPARGDAPWRAIYEAVVGGEVMLLALLILFLAVQGRHFVRIFRFGSAYADRRARRNAWTGAILIVAWYWVGVLSLYFVQALTIGLIPDLASVSEAMLEMLPVAALNPIMTLFITGVGGLSITLLQALYFLRELLLFIYLYGMPIGIALAFGQLPIVSRIAAKLCRQFVPLVLLPLPAAVLFRGYALLFADDLLPQPADALFQYVTVISLPLLALYLTWKTFQYAAPAVSTALSKSATAAVTVGAVAGVGYVAGAGAASTAARFGPKAGVGHAAVQRIRDDHSSQPTTASDSLATDADGGVPAYRRGENDPGYY